ncbi:hypothetical protein OQB17_004216 [Salmonella enterica]|nr:hypothetical protein [Salmonella enterica]
MVFLRFVFGCVLGFIWFYLSGLPHFNHQSMIICLVYGVLLGLLWVVFGFLRVTKDFAGLPFLLRRLASVTVYASPSPFSEERPSSRFRGITLPSNRRRLRYSTVGLTRYRTR